MIRIYESPTGQAGEYNGVLVLGNGAIDGSITYDTLPRTPIAVQLTVAAPVSGYNIFPRAVIGTLTSTGFDFVLSAATDTDTYELHYSVKY